MIAYALDVLRVGFYILAAVTSVALLGAIIGRSRRLRAILGLLCLLLACGSCGNKACTERPLSDAEIFQLCQEKCQYRGWVAYWASEEPSSCWCRDGSHWTFPSPSC